MRKFMRILSGIISGNIVLKFGPGSEQANHN